MLELGFNRSFELKKLKVKKMLIVKYGIGKKGSNGYTMKREKLEGHEYHELMDSINALIVSKLKKMKKIDYNDSVMIDVYFYM